MALSGKTVWFQFWKLGSFPASTAMTFASAGGPPSGEAICGVPGTPKGPAVDEWRIRPDSWWE